MPFKSEAQRGLFWAKVGRGEMSKATAERWEAHTPKGKKLPEYVGKVKQQGLRRKIKRAMNSMSKRDRTAMERNLRVAAARRSLAGK